MMTINNTDPYHWNDSLTGDYLWSNVNFGEAVTHAMTPLTWAVIHQFTLKDWQYIPGYPTTGNIGGFPYLNISVFISLFRALGRSRQDLMDELEATLYLKLPEGTDLLAFPLSRGKLLASLWNSGRIRMQQALGVRQAPAYINSNLEWFLHISARIRSVESGQSLRKLFQREMAAHILQGRWCVLGVATHSANYTIRLRRELTRLVGPDDANILIANTGKDGNALTSLEPMIGLAKVANGELSRQRYLEDFGHRGPDEFELSVPRPAEDPQWVDEQIEIYRQSPVDVDALLNAQRQAYKHAWQRLVAHYPQGAKSIERRIRESARMIQLREAARSAYVRDRWAVRLFALRAGELSGLGEDIFFLTLGEALKLLAGDRAAAQYIAMRKLTYQRYQSLPPYPSVIQGAFDPLAEVNKLPAAPAPVMITGSPGSAGLVEGIVRILRDPAEGCDLQPGEILVAYQTDIAWSMLFPLAAAVITDVGAPLSHAAIVARELGIPAVVGCGNATQLLKTGDRVRVDGGRGTIEILNT